MVTNEPYAKFGTFVVRYVSVSPMAINPNNDAYTTELVMIGSTNSRSHLITTLKPKYSLY